MVAAWVVVAAEECVDKLKNEIVLIQTRRKSPLRYTSLIQSARSRYPKTPSIRPIPTNRSYPGS